MNLQKIYKYAIYFIGGLFFAGVLYDTISNAISLITPEITYWGSGLILITWILLVVHIRKKGVEWKLPGGTKTSVKKLNSQVHLFFIGVIFSLWLPIIFDRPDKLSEQEELIFSIDSTYHVLLLPFGADGNCILESNQYHWQVQRRLDKLNESENLGLEVQRQDTIMCDLLKADSVRAYGKKLGADLVIYGNYQERCEWDTTLLSIQYVLVDTVIRISPFSDQGETKHAVQDNKSLVELGSGKITGTVEDVMYWTLGMREYGLTRYQQSIQYLERINVFASKKEHAIIFKILGSNKDKLDNYEAAVEDFDIAIQLDPKGIYAYTKRGNIKSKLGDLEGALQDLNTAIQLDPNNALLYMNRGGIKSLFRDYEAAFEDYRQAEQLNPKLANSYYNWGVVKKLLGKDDEVIEDFDQVIQLDQKDISVYYYRGLIKRSLGNYKAAIEDFNQVIQLNSKIASPYLSRGITERSLGNYEAAIADFGVAIQLDPKYASAYYGRGLVKRSLGNYEAAIADFDVAIQLDPEFAIAYINRGIARHGLGKYEAAIEDYDVAIQFSSKKYYINILRKLTNEKLKEERNNG